LNTVLLVDDDDLVLSFLEEAMKICEYPYISAKNGDEAYDFFSQNKEKIALVITDINMPGNTNGILLTEKIKKEKNIPVIMISGFLDNEERAKAVGDVFIRKPFQIDQIIQALGKFL